jgi:A/G-specific adenine glycosylase
LLPAQGVEAYTQGLMDLGSGVCTLRRPACERCPLQDTCVARRQARPQDFPVKTRRLKRGRREHVLLWLCQGDRLWLVQRPDAGVWAGLWSLPEWPADEDLQPRVAAWPGQGEVLPAVEHALTHFDWTLRPLRWTWPQDLAVAHQQSLEAALPAGRWMTQAQALQLGLPAPVRRLLSFA